MTQPQQRAGGPAGNGHQSSGLLPIGERATPARVAPVRRGFGPPAMMGGGPVDKSLNFWPSARRLLGKLRPEAFLAGAAVVLGATAVGLSVLGPRLLGDATNLIFGGYISKHLPAHATKAGIVLANGNLLVFRGNDAAGHEVAMILSGKITKSTAAKNLVLTPSLLTIGYIQTPGHQDVYAVPKGAF